MKKLLLALGLAVPVCLLAQNGRTALDRYVAKPDPCYKWELVRTFPGGAVTGYLLGMTSQNWLEPNEVSRTEWRHWVVVHRPEKVESDVALLMIGGGSNEGKQPEKMDAFLQQAAEKTHTVAVELRMIPNQPLSFFGEARKRSEDAIIAYTWRKFLETGDERWPARLPMTKAAVRAMDAAQEFLASEAGGRVKVSRWVVMGGSKRGWTTWTTAAVDKRVVAIAPVVIDTLNLNQSFLHHWRVYGFWAPAVHDYVEHGVMQWANTKEMKALSVIEDPYEYRDRLTLPKYIVNSAGDQFFPPDSSRFYFDDLKGEKYLRYAPNTDHGVTRRSDVAESLLAFYHSVVAGWRRPAFSWSISPAGVIDVTCKDQPTAVKLWRAVNPEARDFRLDKLGPAYKSQDLSPAAPGQYQVKLSKPEKGYSASFVELTFRTPDGGDWKFTTAVKVLPDVYPAAPFEPKR
jgi:PhoPQ-activated pathogenicity-related protein